MKINVFVLIALAFGFASGSWILNTYLFEHKIIEKNVETILDFLVVIELVIGWIIVNHYVNKGTIKLKGK